MRKPSVSTLVTVDGVNALEQLQAADYFLIGRIASQHAGQYQGGAYLDRLDEIPKLLASIKLTELLWWNAIVINGDVAAERDPAQAALTTTQPPRKDNLHVKERQRDYLAEHTLPTTVPGH